MKVRFTKMQGAGNDFVVLDATQSPLTLSEAQMRFLGDRRFGVGADQILVIEPGRTPDVDFGYRIFNNSGAEVEQCGNGARCFVRYVHDKGLSHKRSIRVQTVNKQMELHLGDDGLVTVDMGAPIFELAQIPFDPQGLSPDTSRGFEQWPLPVAGHTVPVAVLSMGNPHAVLLVDDVDTAPVESWGPLIERHACFPRKVNVGFLQVLDRGHVRLRVFERDAGETLACGSGSCAAVVAGIRLGLLDQRVELQARGGNLRIEWAGALPSDAGTGFAPVLMTGPATTVYEGEIEL